MRPVRRDEIVDHVTYREGREASRARIMALKAARRVHVGPCLTFLFENRETIRYQVQEMMLAERIVREADIQHELDTYNEVLGGPGQLGATLLIEIDDPARRDVLLRRWLDLPAHLYARLEDGTRVRPAFDSRQVGEERLSSVHYLTFDTRGRVPVAIGCDHPEIAAEATLTAEQRQALAEDLAQD
jgi:hypothetical protein